MGQSRIESYRKKLGKSGEKLVEKYLERKQYSITEKNYRSPFGEVDLIAETETTMAFVEVKTRSNEKSGGLRDCIDKAKIRRIYMTAIYYLSLFPSDKEIRFDIAYLLRKGEYFLLEYHDSAFTLDYAELDIPHVRNV